MIIWISLYFYHLVIINLYNLIVLHATPFLQYHVLPPTNSNNKCVKTPDKNNDNSITLFLFHSLHTGGKDTEKNLPTIYDTNVPTTTNIKPTTIASINKLNNLLISIYNII